MVYPHSNSIGKEKPPSPSKLSWADMFNEEMNAIKSQVLGNMIDHMPMPVAAPKQYSKQQSIIDEMIYYINQGLINKKEIYNQLYGKKPEPMKTIQPDFPIYSQKAHELRLVLKVEGLGIGNQTIGAKWMVTNEHIHHHKGLPVDQAEHLIDSMLASIKKNLMNQIKEKAK